MAIKRTEHIDHDARIAIVPLIRGALDAIDIGPMAWEGDEDIMTIEGQVVGMTVSRQFRHDWERWWTAEARQKLAEFISEYITQKE